MKRILAVLVLVLASLSMSGIASADECVPADAYTETTGWVLEQPAGDGWVLVDTRTVVDEEAWDEVISEAIPAQHYSYKGGPIEGVPLTPAEDPDSWQANTEQEPHYQGNGVPASKPDGTPYVEGDSGLHYTSHQSEGLADWFYFQPAVDAVIEHHDAVTHDEYKYKRHHDAVTCPPDHNPPPPDKNPPKPPHEYPPLAMTGGDATVPGIIAVVLALIGGGALWYSRKLRI